MTSKELDAVIDRIDIDDEQHFGDYITRIFRDSPTGDRSHDEFNSKGYPTAFLGQCYTLVQTMINKGFLRKSFHALIVLKSLLHARNERLDRKDWVTCQTHNRLDQMIRAFADPSLTKPAITGSRIYTGLLIQYALKLSGISPPHVASFKPPTARTSAFVLMASAFTCAPWNFLAGCKRRHGKRFVQSHF